MLSIPTTALPVSGRGYHLSPRHREHPLISTLLNRVQRYKKNYKVQGNNRKNVFPWKIICVIQ